MLVRKIIKSPNNKIFQVDTVLYTSTLASVQMWFRLRDVIKFLKIKNTDKIYRACDSSQFRFWKDFDIPIRKGYCEITIRIYSSLATEEFNSMR